MKVINSEENRIEFDNGLIVIGDGDIYTRPFQYLDFEQLPVGTELPTMDLEDFHKAITIKDDGFRIKDIDGISKWVQASSEKNGYNLPLKNLILRQGETTLLLYY